MRPEVTTPVLRSGFYVSTRESAENSVWSKVERVGWSSLPSGPKTPKDSWHSTAAITEAGRRDDITPQSVWIHGSNPLLLSKSNTALTFHQYNTMPVLKLCSLDTTCSTERCSYTLYVCACRVCERLLGNSCCKWEKPDVCLQNRCWQEFLKVEHLSLMDRDEVPSHLKGTVHPKR